VNNQITTHYLIRRFKHMQYYIHTLNNTIVQ